MNKLLLILVMLNCSFLSKTQTSVNDGDWKSNHVVLENTQEADFMIRVGDVDNLNFGWPAGFDPFCGKSTPRHKYPWQSIKEDVAGMDRILLGSKFNGKGGTDGYSVAYSSDTKPVPIEINLEKIKGVAINEIKMQVFVDDFQSLTRKSNFRATINGKRFIEMEKLLKVMDQTGPIGKLITVAVNPELLPEFSNNKISFLIDDPTTGIGDGYAIDFVKILVNPKPNLVYKGAIKGIVKNQKGQGVDSVEIQIPGKPTIKTGPDGTFEFNDVQTGLLVLQAFKKDFATFYKNVDVECNKTTQVMLVLNPSRKLQFNGKNITEGDALTLSKIQFSAGSALLSQAARSELDQIYTFLNTNKTVEIELNGFTSSEGEANFNRELSLKRVDACKTYLCEKGIDEKRIFTVGYGPDKPVAPNDTEANRAKNRRVEMKITKIR